MADGNRDDRNDGPTERRRFTANAFRYIEHAFYVAVAIALSVAGAILFGFVAVRFIRHLSAGLLRSIFELLDGLLLVFIIGEVIHTIAAVIHENTLRTEPFLIVGIIAAIRRLLIITAEAERLLGRPAFPDLMWELGLLLTAVLALGITIFLIRHTERREPLPEPVSPKEQAG